MLRFIEITVVGVITLTQLNKIKQPASNSQKKPKENNELRVL
jgi:hypothetical protein